MPFKPSIFTQKLINICVKEQITSIFQLFTHSKFKGKVHYRCAKFSTFKHNVPSKNLLLLCP